MILEQPIDQKGHYSQSYISNTALMPRLMFLSKTDLERQQNSQASVRAVWMELWAKEWGVSEPVRSEL